MLPDSPQEPGRQRGRRLQIGHNGQFFADFLPNIQIFISEIVKNLAIAGANFHQGAFCRPGSYLLPLPRLINCEVHTKLWRKFATGASFLVKG